MNCGYILILTLFSVNISFAQSDVVPSPPPPPAIELNSEMLIGPVKPSLPGCEDVHDLNEKRECEKSALIDYVNRNLVYPIEARMNKTEGKVYAQFLINYDGSISDIKIVKDIGDGCGDAVLEVLEFVRDNFNCSID